MEINDFVGIPYEAHGRSFTGCDCYGLVCLFYKHYFNKLLPNFLEYSEDLSSYASSIELVKHPFGFREIDEPKLGDVGVFKYMGFASHVGVYIGDGKVLHILRKTHSVVQKLDNISLRGRLDGWYRYEK